jgi:hypothetical protein
MTDGLSKEDAYVALTRAREATELYALSREPIERAEFAPTGDERTVELDDFGRELERSEEGALAIDEHVRGALERRSTVDLVAELERHERERVDPSRRRAQALRTDLAETEARLAELSEEVERLPRRGRERSWAVTVYNHTAERAERLRAEERKLPAPSRTAPASSKRVASIGRELSERRRVTVEVAIATEPAYVTDALGRRPEALRDRLAWERVVERLETLRQRLGVKDRERGLGGSPRDLDRRRCWREAERELESLRRRFVERSATRACARGMGIER